MSTKPPTEKEPTESAPFLFGVCAGKARTFLEYRDPAERQACALFHSHHSPTL